MEQVDIGLLAEQNMERALGKERLTLPFSSEALNKAYLYMREAYKISHKSKMIMPPECLRCRLKEEFRSEIGKAESELHRFMHSLIHHYWDGAPISIDLLAYGTCPTSPKERVEYRQPLGDSMIEVLKTPDRTLAPAIITCKEHGLDVSVESSSLEYMLKGTSAWMPEYFQNVKVFQSRVKLNSMAKKLTMGVVGHKDHPLDLRGTRMICPDLDSYHHAISYLMERIRGNNNIKMVPTDDAIEEYVTWDRSIEDTAQYRNSDMPIMTDIKKPGTNGGTPYESFHCLLRYDSEHANTESSEKDGERGVPIEIQVRTIAMHENAERGAAAHRLYKIEQERKLCELYPDFKQISSIIKELYGF